MAKKGSLFLLVSLATVMVVRGAGAPVKPGVYSADMEKYVREVVGDSKNKAILPGLVRLLFHDAFVRGLDGSVLLTSTPFNTSNIGTTTNLTGPTEQGSPSNGGLRGLEVIDEIRAKLAEKNITQNCSCADAVAFAAREATFILSRNLIKYDINGVGRPDGVVSMADEPGNNLPGPTFNFTQLLANFTNKGLTKTDLVSLSGAHCIGDTHLLAFVDRLDPTVSAPPPGRNEINATYQRVITAEAAGPGNMTRSFKNNIRDMGSAAVNSSRYTPNKVNMTEPVDTLDNSFYNANLQNMVRFKSDWELRTDGVAAGLMITYRDDLTKWINAFKAAMTKLSNNVVPPAGSRVEIGRRIKCSATNFNTTGSYP